MAHTKEFRDDIFIKIQESNKASASRTSDEDKSKVEYRALMSGLLREMKEEGFKPCRPSDFPFAKKPVPVFGITNGTVYVPATAVVENIVMWDFNKAIDFHQNHPGIAPNPFKVWLSPMQIGNLQLQYAAPEGREYGGLVVQSGSGNYIADVYKVDVQKGAGISLSEQLAYGLGLGKGSKVSLYLPHEEQQRVKDKTSKEHIDSLLQSLLDESQGIFSDSIFGDERKSRRTGQLNLSLDLLHSSVSEYSIFASSPYDVIDAFDGCENDLADICAKYGVKIPK